MVVINPLVSVTVPVVGMFDWHVHPAALFNSRFPQSVAVPLRIWLAVPFKSSFPEPLRVPLLETCFVIVMTNPPLENSVPVNTPSKLSVLKPALAVLTPPDSRRI